MKKLFFLVFAASLVLLGATAVATTADDGDAILGNWFAEQHETQSHIAITKSSDGTYRAQLYWLNDSTDADGNKRLDKKNPDKSLRIVPIDEVVLFSGLQYDSSRKQWGGTKIYDPGRGIKANVTITLENENKTLKLRGSVLGIGETVYWTRIED